MYVCARQSQNQNQNATFDAATAPPLPPTSGLPAAAAAAPAAPAAAASSATTQPLSKFDSTTEVLSVSFRALQDILKSFQALQHCHQISVAFSRTILVVRRDLQILVT